MLASSPQPSLVLVLLPFELTELQELQPTVCALLYMLHLIWLLQKVSISTNKLVKKTFYRKLYLLHWRGGVMNLLYKWENLKLMQILGKLSHSQFSKPFHYSLLIHPSHKPTLSLSPPPECVYFDLSWRNKDNILEVLCNHVGYMLMQHNKKYANTKTIMPPKKTLITKCIFCRNCYSFLIHQLHYTINFFTLKSFPKMN